jgi:hypothetical protein
MIESVMFLLDVIANRHITENKPPFQGAQVIFSWRNAPERRSGTFFFFAGTGVTNTILLRPFQNLFSKEKTRWTQVIEDAWSNAG